MAASITTPTPIAPELLSGAGPTPTGGVPNTSSLQVIRRSGSYSPFDANKISVAITKAFVAVEGSEATASRRIHEAVEGLTQQIVDALTRHMGQSRVLHIEDIQDQVELALMRSGEHKVARAYVLYRNERAQERKRREESLPPQQARLSVRLADGISTEPLDERQIEQN
ncbi:MAG TPA: ATP cone domain-containing protein, partial [Edaphobacter sp.]|nr:ATP cone domain-containing protein [Edaphobacter sp.]